jgi:integrase
MRSWIKDVELLRQFFEFCRDREWTANNPARAMKIPRKQEANDVVPYTREEIIKIIAAGDEIGRSSYERRRARAMVLLMRYAGLRISDVVTLERDHIRGSYLMKHAVKNHRPIQVELPRPALEALELLPLPIAAARDNRRFFFSDTTGLRTLVPPDISATPCSYGHRRWGERCASPDTSSAVPTGSWSGQRSNPVDRSR